MRTVASKVLPLAYRARHGKRLKGTSYILRRPSLIRIGPRGSLTIGHGVMIDKDARIIADAPLTIGDNVFIGKNATLVALEPLEIGSGVLIGENVSIHTEDHGPAGARSSFAAEPVTLEPDCWLGAGVVVTKGVTVGRGSTVGANAVVTRDVPPNRTAMGVPARVRDE